MTLLGFCVFMDLSGDTDTASIDPCKQAATSRQSLTLTMKTEKLRRFNVIESENSISAQSPGQKTS